MSQGPGIQVCRLGSLSYLEAWALQKELAGLRKRDLIEDCLLLLEHPHVITYGRNVGASSLLLTKSDLLSRGVELIESDRGGDATYHGPGQLVAYPIIDLKVDMQDVRKYVWTLEECMISVMSEYGLQGDRIEGAPGAWLKAQTAHSIDRKMGAVGVRLSRWVTHHGVGFNVNIDLSFFKLIVPCGLADKGVTSLQDEYRRVLDFHQVQDHFIKHFSRLFNRKVIELSPDALSTMIRDAKLSIEEYS